MLSAMAVSWVIHPLRGKKMENFDEQLMTILQCFVVWRNNFLKKKRKEKKRQPVHVSVSMPLIRLLIYTATVTIQM